MTAAPAADRSQLGAHVRQLTIAEVVQETKDAVSIAFRIPDDMVEAFKYWPGQYLTLRIPSERTGSVARCYSICSSPHLDDDEILVTVKRTPEGYASNWLCDNAAPGMSIPVLPPSGTFYPRSFGHDLLMFAAGSGITPIISIIKSALAAGTARVALFYANRDPESVIFAKQLAVYAEEFPDRFVVQHWLESEQGRPSAEALAAFTGGRQHSRVFMCGPAPFMDAVAAAATGAGVEPAQLHREAYFSLDTDPFAPVEVRNTSELPPARVTVQLDDGEHVLAWDRETPLLNHLLEQGLDVPYSCRQGECSSCVCSILDGEVRLLRNETLVDEDIRLGLTLACQAVPETDEVIIAFDQ
ncbi:Oxidoreductase FAD-binding domain protein [Segniliparus rotundus DSM 44985]|uniref:Oxidoreductase FAD-binding domain protein n=1 Tax=Segniliparus rotundus (strain ATCC BAA-972 / CDC 1076 / CIP 108378 / DSM 44985 / JCM 13578) TaxID=640132 RepID=D6ZBS1_SEGRD|nr:ferredoxin--NADP reductase [Segniliparus rotundus]ADG96898.1 Oxidoreductase FAD-binding domain protein [Segniliparus rotundus DSM 44985]